MMRRETFICVSGIRYAAKWCQRVSESAECVRLVDECSHRFASSLRELYSYVSALCPWECSIDAGDKEIVCRMVSDFLQSYDHSIDNTFTVQQSDQDMELYSPSGHTLGIFTHKDVRMLLGDEDVTFLDITDGMVLLSVDVGHWYLWISLLPVIYRLYEDRRD